MKVVGVQHYAFDGNDGKRIEGNKLHVTLETPEMEMLGTQVQHVSCNDAILKEMLNGMATVDLIGKSIEVIYNRYGKPAHIHIIK